MHKILLICLVLIPLLAFSQTIEKKYNNKLAALPQWAQMMYSDTAEAFEVEQAYRAYYQKKPFVKNSHTQYFKRWLRQLARSPYWEGMSALEKRNYQQNLATYQQATQQLKQRSPSSVWQGIGPFDFDRNAASTSYACGAAHLYTVEQAPSDAQTLYAGTATAGVWKSSNKGLSWNLITADWPIITCRALEIDFSNEQVVYAASDYDGNLYKTNNSGSSWQVAGDTAFSNQAHAIPDIVMHPDSNQVVLVASDKGLYRTNDGGASFQLVQSGAFQEIEFHPYLSNIVYAVQQTGSQTVFYKSTDHGWTFVPKTNGWPVPNTSFDEQKRTEIAVTLADSNRIYALCTGNVGLGAGLYGIYISNDAGESWSSICCGASMPNFPSVGNPNMMHWADDGTGNGGQYYYDLALEASPTNADSVWVAGVNLWVSGDGGNSFSCPAQWNHNFKPNYVHADIHDIRFFGPEIWIACDGGIFRSRDNGLTYNRQQEGIMGTDFWGFGAGHQDGEVMIGGTFHNGTMLKDNQVYINDWISTGGGDNFRGYVLPTQPRKAISDFGLKTLSGNRLLPNNDKTLLHLPHGSRTVSYSGNIAFHPQLQSTFFSTAYDQIWRTDDNGNNWQLVSDFGSGLLHSLQIAWNNPAIMYVAYQPSNNWGDRKIYKTTDGGQNWTDITPASAVIASDRWVPYDLAVSATDDNTLWAARTSPYEGTPILDGQQVYKSTDGGQNWTNITFPDLNGEYITNIEHHRGSNGGVYVGTRRAIYYKNNNMFYWALFNNGLPLWTHSVNLVPNYKKGKLINGTSRSVYECDFYEDPPPHAQVSVSTQSSHCTRDTVQFASYSAARNPITYSWQFQGGNPTTSTQENPKVVYPSAGTYAVTLTVTDALGSHTQVLPNFMTIYDDCTIDTVAGMALHCSNTNDYIETNALGWYGQDEITLSAWIKADTIQTPNTGIITHSNDSIPAGLLLGTNNELIFQWTGASWNWNSGLFVPVGEWTHVAVVIRPDSAVVYLNGVGSSYTNNLFPLDWFGGVVIGRYANWASRNLKGQIEEVCIWDKALTQDELRKTLHLTKYLDKEPHLKHYYQFNAQATEVQDRVGILHAAFRGGASRMTSTAPVGGGSSQKKTIVAAGSYAFPQAFLSLHFDNNNTLPAGEVVANRLNVWPDQTATSNSATQGYWIINNYGNNATIDIDSLALQSPWNLSYMAPDYQLFGRMARSEGTTWNLLDTADALQGKALSFGDGLMTTNYGQFMIGIDSQAVILPTVPLEDKLPQAAVVYPNPLQAGAVLHIETQEETTFRLVVYNMEGKVVFESSEWQEKQHRLQLPMLPQGIYAYRLISDKHIKNGLLQIVTDE